MSIGGGTSRNERRRLSAGHSGIPSVSRPHGCDCPECDPTWTKHSVHFLYAQKMTIFSFFILKVKQFLSIFTLHCVGFKIFVEF